MKCKKCGKECMESELVNGFCSDCIKQYGENSQELKSIDNRIANIFKILVFIIALIGIILAIWGFTINIFTGILVLISTFLIALMFRAIAEIIQLLEDIKNK